MTTRTIKVRRMDGTVAHVPVLDAQHYEVDLEGTDPEDGEVCWWHHVVVAETAAQAKRVARGIATGDQRPVSARKLSHGEVAVFALHGVTPVMEPVR